MGIDYTSEFIDEVKVLLTQCRCRVPAVMPTYSNESSYSMDKTTEFPLLGLTVYGKSTQDGTPNPTNPVPIVSVGDDGELKVTSCGKNLLDWNKLYQQLNNVSKITKTIEGEKLTLSGTSGSTYRQVRARLAIPSVCKGKKVKFSGILTGDEPHVTINVLDETGKQLTALPLYKSTLVKEATIPQNAVEFLIVFCLNTTTIDVQFTAEYSNMTFTLAETDNIYEPYTGSTAAITSALPLCAVPVPKGGNYTDVNGQQWACDELIYNADGTGKVAKRVKKFVADGVNMLIEKTNNGFFRFCSSVGTLGGISTSVYSGNSPCFCTRFPKGELYTPETINYTGNFFYLIAPSIGIDSNVMSVDEFKAWLVDNPMDCYYELATPEEIELTAEEMAQLQALYSHEGTTTVFNDEGADMDVQVFSNATVAAEILPLIRRLESQSANASGGYSFEDAMDIGFEILDSPYSSEHLANLIPSFANATAEESASVTVDGVTYTASASSAWTWSSSNNYAYHAFDGDWTSRPDNGVGWYTAGGALAADTWLQIEADRAFPIPDMALLTYASSLTGDVTCVVQSSVDGESWTNVSDIVTLPTTGSQSASSTIRIPLRDISGSELKYRLQFLSSVDATIMTVNGNLIAILEFGLMQYKEG